jgi:hypothetical protein
LSPGSQSCLGREIVYSLMQAVHFYTRNELTMDKHQLFSIVVGFQRSE